MRASTTGYLLIADISGYTAFLQGSELDHAQEVLTRLLKLLLEQTREPMVVSRTAGDAVISYALGEPFLQPQTMVDRLEATYSAFRDAIDRMVLNTRCTCAACANVGSLDLKFFLHHGTFAIQDLGGHHELVGSDVNLLHRLLKNSVVETTGFRAYALYTRAAIDHLGLGEWESSLIEHREHYEHLGEVVVHIQDLAPVADAARAARSAPLPREEVTFESVLEITRPVSVVWDALNDPECRKMLIGSTAMSRSPKGGRMGAEAEFICYHGDTLTRQEVVVYQPLQRLLTNEHVHLPVGIFTIPMEYELEVIDGGTRVTERFASIRGSWWIRPLAWLMQVLLVRPGRSGLLSAFKARLESRGAAAPPTSSMGV